MAKNEGLSSPHAQSWYIKRKTACSRSSSKQTNKAANKKPADRVAPNMPLPAVRRRCKMS